MKLTKQQGMAVAAAAILYACQDDNLRDLTADDRALALDGRHTAAALLTATGVQPTELKAAGLALLAEVMGR